MKARFFPFLFSSSLILTACTSGAAAKSPAAHDPSTPALPSQAAAPQPSGALTRVDEQGVVVVEVTPVNLSTTAQTLDFDIVMNTHSVDLSMNLASLASLTTDTGISVPATSWSSPGGGHHVRGRLSFPTLRGGKPILAGATRLTLTITNLHAPSRTFEWQLR